MLSKYKITGLSLVILASAITFVLSTNSSNGSNRLERQPATRTILRRKDQLGGKPGFSDMQNERPPAKERVLENEIPKHLPIKIKIKKEKEFKNLNNENWANDFELEVTNIGGKPIYFLHIILITDVKAAAGYQIVFPLYFGRAELGNYGVLPEPEDVPIKPGESFGLRIHEGQMQAWEQMNRREGRPHPKKIRAKFQWLFFGDGTGYGPGGIHTSDWTNQKRISQCEFNDRRSGPLTGEWLASVGSNWPTKMSRNDFTGSFLTGVFFGRSTTAFSFVLPPTLGCCDASGCAFLKVSTSNVCVNCPPQERTSTAFCGDVGAACWSADYSTYTECPLGNGETYACQRVILDPCGGGSPPSPSPTPTPSPTPATTPQDCDPNTRPNDTNCSCVTLPGIGPSWSCYCPGGATSANYIAFPQSGGCDPSRSFNNGSNCCSCIGPVTCGAGSYWDASSCQCEENPVPTATPKPAGHYQYECIEYFWVRYDCYPIGEDQWDCYEVDRWYAGCW